MNMSLDLYWQPGRGDNMVIANADSRQAAVDAGYAFVRREAYLFSGGEPDIKPLNLYWHPGREDTFTAATAQAEQDAINQGYEFVRTEGYVKTAPGPNTVPLKLYYGDSRGDHFLTGTAPGETAALDAGYRFVRIEGYGSLKPPTRSATVRSEVGQVIPKDAVMTSTVTVDSTGRIEGLTETVNYAAFWGYQGGLAAYFSDANGMAIPEISIKREPFGVNGTVFGFSSRRDPWFESVPAHVVPRIENIHIWHFIGGPTLNDIKRTVTEGVALATPIIGLAAQLKALGAKGQ